MFLAPELELLLEFSSLIETRLFISRTRFTSLFENNLGFSGSRFLKLGRWL